MPRTFWSTTKHILVSIGRRRASCRTRGLQIASSNEVSFRVLKGSLRCLSRPPNNHLRLFDQHILLPDHHQDVRSIYHHCPSRSSLHYQCNTFTRRCHHSQEPSRPQYPPERSRSHHNLSRQGQLRGQSRKESLPSRHRHGYAGVFSTHSRKLWRPRVSEATPRWSWFRSRLCWHLSAESWMGNRRR